jgi:hypothetical protein
VVAFVVSRTGNSLAPALYVIAGAVVTALVLTPMTETGGRTLPEPDGRTATPEGRHHSASRGRPDPAR